MPRRRRGAVSKIAKRLLACALAALAEFPSLVDRSAMAAAETPSAYPMQADAWTMESATPWVGSTAGAAKFARYEGMPTGTMTLNEGIASSKFARFSTGTIEFDIKPIGYDDAGIIFHRRGIEDGEFFYLRANPDCPAANDCIQYAPITHTLMGWNIYPNYQRPAQIASSGWNHVRLRVSGDSMVVYLNRASEPSLIVPRLRGLAHDGGIGFKGPAIYANLLVSASDASKMPTPAADPLEPGTLTAWVVSQPTAHDRSQPVSVADAPAAGTWTPIEVEPTGLVNLGRAFGVAKAPSLSLGWLKTVVKASTSKHCTLRLGFAPQVWVFLNRQLVYSGDNSYFPAASRLSPDGRLEADNASIPLDLRPGRNEIILAVGNDWGSHGPVPKPTPFGWAVEAHLDSLDGLDLPSATSPRFDPVVTPHH